MGSKKKNQRGYHNPNGWGALQNVMVASMNKGQLIPTGMILFVLISVLKMPSEDCLPLLKSLYLLLADWNILGWTCFILLSAAFVWRSKMLRRVHAGEINRMAKEKSDLQQQLIDKRHLKSSKKRK